MLKAAENLFYLSLLYCRCRRAADAAADAPPMPPL